jgi:hypothetical protein
MGLANTGAIGKKRKSEPQDVPTQDAVQAPLPPKKKKKAIVESAVKPSQPSATTNATERDRDHQAAPSKTKKMNGGPSAKKRTTHNESGDVSITADQVHPAKKAKVVKPAGITSVPIHRSGKIF